MKDKTIKSHIAKIFVAIGGLATLVESCQSTFIPLGSENFAEDTDQGLSLLPLDIYLPEDVSIQGIMEFSAEAFNNPDFTNSFYDNPDAILQQYGILGYDKNSPQIQMLLASGDPDVKEKILNKDFRGYLDILQEKNYLQSEIITDIRQLLDYGYIPNTKKAQTVQLACMIPVFAGMIALIFVGAVIWTAIATFTAIYVEGTKARTNIAAMNIFHDNAMILYRDMTKNLNIADISEDEYITELRSLINQLDFAPDFANDLFRVSCGAINNITDKTE